MGFAVPDDAVLISDGGLATELEARGHRLSEALWSARLLIDAPEEIRAVHAAFYRAGATIATTASYQGSVDGFATRGVGRAQANRLLRTSVRLARDARDEVGGAERVVAASVGPYGAALADGSEYRGRYGRTVAELARWHGPRMELLAEAGADLLALETIPDIDEAAALTSVLGRLDVPAWLSYSVDGARTRAGQPLSDAFALAAEAPQLVAVGVNCCAPADVLAAIRIARRESGKPVVVYPNSGEGWDAGRRSWTGPPQPLSALVPDWIAAGAHIVGGCCRVRPADIATIADVAAASAW